MKKLIWFALALVLVAAVGCTSYPVRSFELGNPSISLNQQTGLWVSGEGKMMASPDIAHLQLGIEAQAATVAEAQQLASQAMSKVIDALKTNGVREKDIQTQRFSIYPVKKWLQEQEKEITIGYRVANMIQAKIRELDLAGETIDAVALAGGDLTRIQNISFAIDDPTPYYEEVRIKAIKDAASKAKSIADAAGVKLGRPFYISEGTLYVPSPVFRGIAEAAAPAPAPTPVSPGEMEIRLNIQIAYAIS